MLPNHAKIAGKLLAPRVRVRVSCLLLHKFIQIGKYKPLKIGSLTMARLPAFVLIALSLFLSPAAAQTKRVALITGNNAYLDLTPLRNPALDACQVVAELRANGHEVLGRYDVKRAGVGVNIWNMSRKPAQAISFTFRLSCRIGRSMRAGELLEWGFVSRDNEAVPVNLDIAPVEKLEEVRWIDPIHKP
jgi:hypothetical protein